MIVSRDRGVVGPASSSVSEARVGGMLPRRTPVRAAKRARPGAVPTSRVRLGGPGTIAFRELRINDQIRIPHVRLFDDTTQEAFGIVPIEKARALAVERELDLVEV